MLLLHYLCTKLYSIFSFVVDYEFTLYSASTLASCSIAAALRGLDLDGHLPRLHELTRIDLVSYPSITTHLPSFFTKVLYISPSIDFWSEFSQQDCLQTCLEQIEEMVKMMIAERGCAAPNGQQREAWTPPPMQGKTHSSAATPTDVRDVHFWSWVSGTGPQWREPYVEPLYELHWQFPMTFHYGASVRKYYKLYLNAFVIEDWYQDWQLHVSYLDFTFSQVIDTL